MNTAEHHPNYYKLPAGPSDSGSDWDESEDINTDSSDCDAGPDNGSDLEGFVDLSDEAGQSICF